MPNWKKLITSGSDATLSSLSVDNQITGSSFTGSFTGSYSGDGSGLSGVSSTGYSNEITLSADYSTTTGTYNSLYGPLTIADGVTVTVNAGSFLKVEDF
jgi:hypothetical protein